MELKGYDWVELAEYFNIDIADSDDSEPVKKYLSENFSNKDVIKGCRKFLKLYNKWNPFYVAPLFNGLSKIKDDDTFMKYFIILVDYIWK